MPTLQQLFRRILIKKKAYKNTPRLKQCPQVRGIVKRPVFMTPKKPNSAKRSVAKVFLGNRLRVTAYIPAKGHNLRAFTKILVRGGGCRDLPGVRYSCVRGARDFIGAPGKSRRRSIYGVKQLKVTKGRRKFRF